MIPKVIPELQLFIKSVKGPRCYYYKYKWTFKNQLIVALKRLVVRLGIVVNQDSNANVSIAPLQKIQIVAPIRLAVKLETAANQDSSVHVSTALPQNYLIAVPRRLAVNLEIVVNQGNNALVPTAQLQRGSKLTVVELTRDVVLEIFVSKKLFHKNSFLFNWS